MATLVLSAAGAALGASIGGGVLGVSSLVIGRAVGATLGRIIDQRLLGRGAEPVETARIERLRVSGSGPGGAVARVWGRTRVAGQVIWCTQFKETATTSGGGGGKGGAPRQPQVTTYSYSVSLALALCEGEILRIGRVWADGKEIETQDLNLRWYAGTPDQLPDPKIEAIEGSGFAPAYRDLAYVVIEDLDLTPFGNRVPQLSFEVVRAAQHSGTADQPSVTYGTQAVAMMPGSGEYVLATTPLFARDGNGDQVALNQHGASGQTDFQASLSNLTDELPNCRAVSLIVSWFGSDLRCATCDVVPKIDGAALEPDDMRWRVSGLTRDTAQRVPEVEGRAIYGGTPTDQSVIEAMQALDAAGQSVMFYPFILMDQLEGNGLPDPWGGEEQAHLPWRGRITTSLAAGQVGSLDGTTAAEAEVAAFFGDAAVGDFNLGDRTVDYTGPATGGYRRFILHYAHLCAASGVTGAFCIGSEMRSLTQIRGAAGYPAVAALRALAADVRSILGPGWKIGYAADWSEYFGHHPGDGDVYFHLDPLWADAAIDFVGIDNYMPLSDWRDGEGHADYAIAQGSLHNRAYLEGNIEGGEGYDWYYATQDARDLQVRTPIVDTAHGEDWVFRYKDIRSWWSLPHHERINGQRQWVATEWVPRSKPIWFTEVGCAAIDKGTNAPNAFLDPKSSESKIPPYSSGLRDDAIQARALEAVFHYWAKAENNPYSELYDGPMLDMSRAHVWAWDARPFPYFPGDVALWSDAENYAKGHWISGRSTAQDVADIARELCEGSGVTDLDVTRLSGIIRGFTVAEVSSARGALQPLMLALGFDAYDRDGAIVFRTRTARDAIPVATETMALVDPEVIGPTRQRAPDAETVGRVRLNYVAADGSFDTQVEEAVAADDPGLTLTQSELPVALTSGEGQALTQRWLAEARVARDSISLTLPPSDRAIGPGDIIAHEDARYRVDRVSDTGALSLEAVRVETEVYRPVEPDAAPDGVPSASVPVPVDYALLDLPLLVEGEVPHAPRIAARTQPWPGAIAVHSSADGESFALNTLVTRAATMGETLDALPRSTPGVWSEGAPLRVRMAGDGLSSASDLTVLNGANALALGAGPDTAWEVIQFRQAVLVGDGIYHLSGLLRGQAGTDGVMPEVWPEGTQVILLNTAVTQLDMALSARGLTCHYRIGPASRPVDDPTYQTTVLAFDGVGLRPYAPVHVRVAPGSLGLDLTWIRRTRQNGDSWQGEEVPLGEDQELYRVRVRDGQTILRSVDVATAQWTYPTSDQLSDAPGPDAVIEVAQVSAQFGPGPYRAVPLAG